MKKHILLTVVAAFGLLSVMVSVPVRQAHAQGNTSKDFVPPIVFQAAGPTVESIQGTVDAFRAALGEPNNANNPGPLQSGRREINWDGGGNNFTTTDPVTPFNVFLDTRGGQFTTPGTGLTQAPPTADPVQFPPGGLAGLFNNPTYGTIFSTFSPEPCSPRWAATSPRLCSSYPAPMGVSQQRSVASAWCSQTLTGRMGAGLARSPETVGPAR